MTGRIPLDELTSDQYDALYERLEDADARNLRLRRDIAGCTADRWPERLAEAEAERDRAKAAVNRVRDTCDALNADVHNKTPVALAGIRHAVSKIRSALDEA
ncbi:hypothetical protein [Streptomyces xanthochromogenes]|uniref:hypothetical protein n=1 Tax=Streptomyces xanthochromogenes TaxID=67384 RepID=UPI003414DF64